jgi:hypothetical protein
MTMTPELRQKLLDELKAELQAQPRRQSRLAGHDELIAAMRAQGAPWTMVQRYLAKIGVELSAEAIRSYWHRHHKSRRQPRTAASVNPKSKDWTFNPPSKLE